MMARGFRLAHAALGIRAGSWAAVGAGVTGPPFAEPPIGSGLRAEPTSPRALRGILIKR